MVKDNQKNIINQVEEQIKFLIERYNTLAASSEKQRRSVKDRNYDVNTFKNGITNEINALKAKITKIESMITSSQNDVKKTSLEFKGIVKKEGLQKLQKKIDALKYEDFMTRDELYRKY